MPVPDVAHVIIRSILLASSLAVITGCDLNNKAAIITLPTILARRVECMSDFPPCLRQFSHCGMSEMQCVFCDQLSDYDLTE